MKNLPNKNNREIKSHQPNVRFQRAERFQIEIPLLSLDQMIPDDDTARLVWASVEGLDLNALYAQIKAVEGAPGRDPIDPKILLALWLYTTVEGINSARRLDKLCRKYFSYLRLCGGVKVNDHTLADFRVQHGDILDDLLTQSVATFAERMLNLRKLNGFAFVERKKSERKRRRGGQSDQKRSMNQLIERKFINRRENRRPI